jgi:hypothetical protein
VLFGGRGTESCRRSQRRRAGLLALWPGVFKQEKRAMAAPLHPAATEHLPSFITPPGETDVLMVVTAIILAVSILMFGILFFRLHHLPESMAHRSKKAQLEIVSLLCLIGLLTHIHAFWIAALLLAFIDLPDFPGWLSRIAGAVERMAPKPGDSGTASRETIADATRAEAPAAAPSVPAAAPALPLAAPSDTRHRSARQKEPTHA